MLQRTEGIVLRTFPFGEADLIVTYITRDFGIVKVFAKSPRKTKSRFGSSLEPLTFARLSFWGKEDAALPRLTQSDIIHPYSSLRESLQCFLRVSELIELTLHFVPERDISRNVYALLMQTLSALESSCSTPLIPISYKVKLLDMVGYLPGLQACGRCGDNSDAFHVSHGTVLCRKCSQDEEVTSRLSPGVRTFFLSLLKWEMEKIDRIKPAGVILAELSVLLDEHVRYLMERDLKTKGFRRA
jgi:DNA repair protein RecO (recombination protein O)